MIGDAITALETNDIDLAKSIIKMDDDVNQFYFLILKQLQFALQNPITMKELGIDLVDVLSYHSVLRRIEHIADHAKAIAESIVSLQYHKAPEKIIKLVSSYLRNAFDIYNQAVESLNSGDIAKANDVINARYKIRNDLSRSLLREIGKDSKVKIEETKATIGDNDKSTKNIQKLARAYEVYCMLRTLADRVERVADYSSDIAEVAINRALKSPTGPTV
jgi:phosphate uptake regulator